MKKLCFIITGLLYSSLSLSQSSNAPLNADYYHLLDRYEILNGRFSSHFHTSAKPYERQDIAAFADELLTDSSRWTYKDRFNLTYLANDNWEYSKLHKNESNRPLFRKFFRKKSDLFYVDEDDFDLHINPVFYLSTGVESASDVNTYTNTRGVDVRGNIAGRLGFYTSIYTTQAAYPLYVRNRIYEVGVVPYEGFWKEFHKDGVDFFTAKGYISFDLIRNYVNAQFGFDKNALGNGHRSFLLSDFSNNYTFLKFNTKIWRLNYTNLYTQAFAQHIGIFNNRSGQYRGSAGTVRFPKKFISTHHLSLNITDNINIGLFETVISGDTAETFNISYLNPIIFYRALEHQDGSIDNAMVGFDYKINFARHFSFYGQLALDEFKLDEITSGEGWWANKYGVQTGLKYINVFGINNLDAQVEYNFARPYLYQHQDIYTNYAHYNMPLGHIQGGNFKEIVTFLRFQPSRKINVIAQLNLTEYGEDPDAAANWGKDVMKSYTTREQDYGNVTGQGISTKLLFSELTVSYQFKHNVFFDVKGSTRRLNSEIDALDENTTFYSGSFRWNIPRRTHDF